MRRLRIILQPRRGGFFHSGLYTTCRASLPDGAILMHMKRLTLSIFILVAIAAGIALFLLPGKIGGSQPIPPTATLGLTGQGSGLHGKIYLSLGASTLLLPEPAVLDLDAGTLIHDGMDDGSIGYEHDVSADRSQVAFIGSTKDLFEKAQQGLIPFGEAIQVYVGSVGADGQLPPPDHSIAITTARTIEKRTPAISPDLTRVLYVANADGTRPSDPKARSLSTYDIHAALADGSDTTIAQGIAPAWLSADAFLFVAADGIREYSFAEATSSLILPDALATNSKIAVSPDGSQLAVSDPDSRTVFLFTLDTRRFPARVGASRQIATLAFWPLFSPDGKYLAIQTADDTGNGVVSDPRIDFYDLSDLHKLPDTVSLAGFDNDRLFMTSWR